MVTLAHHSSTASATSCIKPRPHPTVTHPLTQHSMPPWPCHHHGNAKRQLEPQRSAPEQSPTPANDTREQLPTHGTVPHQYGFRCRATSAEFGDRGATASLLAGTSAKQGSSGPRGAASDVWFAAVPVSSNVESETLPSADRLVSMFFLLVIVSHNIQENMHIFLLFSFTLPLMSFQPKHRQHHAKESFRPGKTREWHGYG